MKAGRGVVKQWWSPGWFPFATNGAGDYYCIDLGPTFPGKRGQVIHFSHECPERPLIAESFFEFLVKLTVGYEAGHYEMGEYGFAKKNGKSFPDAKY